jgi:hypothetical protein
MEEFAATHLLTSTDVNVLRVLGKRQKLGAMSFRNRRATHL